MNGKEVVSQRFAIDWIRVDRKHRAWVGDPARLSSYRNYGKPLIAAAGGKVIHAADGRPNQPPPNNPTPPSVPELAGNRVILRVGPGIYLTSAHMVPGSVRVHVGEHVRRGQVLGWLGNSGNSATPHLHLQVQVTRNFTATACRSSSGASDSWARSPSRSRTRTSACGRTASCPLPEPTGRVPDTTRCRSISTSCDFQARNPTGRADDEGSFARRTSRSLASSCEFRSGRGAPGSRARVRS